MEPSEFWVLLKNEAPQNGVLPTRLQHFETGAFEEGTGLILQNGGWLTNSRDPFRPLISTKSYLGLSIPVGSLSNQPRGVPTKRYSRMCPFVEGFVFFIKIGVFHIENDTFNLREGRVWQFAL